MARKRIVAHFMHEHERDSVRPLLSEEVLRDGFWIANVDERDIPQIRKNGLFVRILEEKPQPPTRPRPSVAAVARPAEDYFLMKIAGPFVQETELKNRNVQVLGRLQGNQLRVRLSKDRARDVESLPFVDSVETYKIKHSGPREEPLPPPPVSVERPPSLPEGLLLFDVLLHREEDAPSFIQWLDSKAIQHPLHRKMCLRILLSPDPATVKEVKDRVEVEWCQRYLPPRLHNDFARRLSGISDAQGKLCLPIALEGEGEVVAVADTGLDQTHPDFAGRIAGLVARGRAGDASDPHGHGTHVAGTALGDGSASNGQLRGAAPKARLFFQSLLDSQGGLGGLPMDLSDLFQEAYAAGARIHNNSWGSAMASHYTVDSYAVDDFVAENPDMLIIFSAGNSGTALGDKRVGKGFVSWTCIDSPATCKNALIVGASRSDRRSGGYAQLTYHDCWPDEFPDLPIAGERVSGNPEGLAAFSSRGPCVDYRIRPDLVAPGTDIASARSADAPGRSFWGSYPANPRYAFMGGTSMAAPFVAGCAALVREYYVKHRGHLKPSAALLKSTLLNGTRWLSGPDSTAQRVQMPNYHQGFGALNLANTLPDPQTAARLEFVDSWQDPATRIDENLRRRVRYQFHVNGGAELRLCLAWTDLPGKSLQNDLNLFLEGPGGSKWSGNDDLPMAITDEDPTNNVELIRIRAPQAGPYMVQITGTNLMKPTQDFALVVLGELAGPLAMFRGA